MAAEITEDDAPEFTEDGDGEDGSENQGPDFTDVGTRENERDNGQDESSGEIPGDIPDENSDHNSEGDPSEGSAEDFEEELNGDPVEDLNLDELDLGGLDFEDDDADEQAGGSKKKENHINRRRHFFGSCTHRTGSLLFSLERREPRWTSQQKTLNRAT